MGGALEDGVDMCRQELADLDGAAEMFAGDATCLAVVAAGGAHLPHPLRAALLRRVRGAVGTASKDGVGGRQSVWGGGCGGYGGASFFEAGAGGSSSSQLGLERFCFEQFVAGSLTNVMQLEEWSLAGLGSNSGGGSGRRNSAGGAAIAKGLNRAGALPFHPAFLDAAVLTLVTDKWPLLVDPEGVAERWLPTVYGAALVLPPVVAARATSTEVRHAAAAGLVLVVSHAQAGLHPDLALFLSHHAVAGGGGGGGGSENWAASMAATAAPGFRIVLLSDRTPGPRREPFAVESSDADAPAVVPLEACPAAAAAVQVIHFGGHDRVSGGAAAAAAAATISEKDSNGSNTGNS
ncbi:unnamed protein product, partial [Phaeothamnion confervicola]